MDLITLKVSIFSFFLMKSMYISFTMSAQILQKLSKSMNYFRET